MLHSEPSLLVKVLYNCDIPHLWVAGLKEMTENKMVGWHHWLDGHESEQALGVGDGQESLSIHAAIHGGCKESDMTQ